MNFHWYESPTGIENALRYCRWAGCILTCLAALAGLAILFLTTMKTNLEERMKGPRHIPDHRKIRTILTSELRPHTATPVTISPLGRDHAADAQAFADDLQRLLTEVGWQDVVRNRALVVGGGAATPLDIVVRSAEGDHLASALLDVFRKLNLRASHRFEGTERVVVIIGRHTLA